MKRMIEQQRKSVFISPEDELIYKENREESDRCTARYEDGRPRLIPGVNLMDAIEELTRIEERKFGPLVVEPSNVQQRCAEWQRKRWAAR